ncbi:vWA domain-containing protein [Chitinimonas lacunae]|uniref:Putative metallopeptidase domain-containing protein n=1 Tax=Chitinimonas lacunae TaxID=1963018 RepID=A0ABV8MMU2_9NEIS
MKRREVKDPAAQARQAGLQLLYCHPVLGHLAGHIRFLSCQDQRKVAGKGWFSLDASGEIWLNGKRRAEPEHWLRIGAMAALMLGFELVRPRDPQPLWELTALLSVHDFCRDAKIGRLPDNHDAPLFALPPGGEQALFALLQRDPPSAGLIEWRDLFGGGRPLFNHLDHPPSPNRPAWKALLAEGIAYGAGRAIRIAGGEVVDDNALAKPLSIASKARRQLINTYPLLGALAASFDLEEDIRICQQYDIQVAAIDVGARRIWMNPSAGLSESEALFVFAHELLHAGLNHSSRRRGRDPLLWNAACDFAINAWLVEMGVGTPPPVGGLLDPQFKRWSAEEIYDHLATDIRRARKLATLRGTGLADMVGESSSELFTDAEAYCRRALLQGMERCFNEQRGWLPAGLVEEIRSLSQPPIPWDVQLAEWFDQHFPPLEVRRSYARPSRRQTSTPTIPRPGQIPPPDDIRHARVFGVLLDTSGSMAPKLLGMALGAIASYALARDVFAVRLVCCDAAAHDEGWIAPERLLDRLSVHGRGGTVLQPGLDHFKYAMASGDFPPAGPLLIITDGYCEDRLTVPGEHAYLLPQGNRLPFAPRGKVFEIA